MGGRNSLTTPGSREPITGPPNSGAIYANVGQVPRNAGDRSSTLPVQGNRVSIGSSEGDSLDGTNHQSGKEKKKRSRPVPWSEESEHMSRALRRKKLFQPD